MNVKAQFKEKPCVIWLDKPYAIGGDVELKATPPKLGKVVSECTDKEYEYLYNLGYIRFFDLETAKVKVNKKAKEDAPVPTHELGNVEQPIKDDNAIASDI
jgi:hypothetical protein